MTLAVSPCARATSPQTWLLLYCWLIASCGANAADHGPRDAIPQVFTGLELRDQEGSALAPAQLQGKTLVLNFLYASCPTVCPMQTRELAKVQRALPQPLRARVQFLSVSVDPAHDTPAVLKSFATAQGADLANWRFAATSARGTEQLTSRLTVFDPRRPESPATHGTSIYLFDAQGRLMQRYAGAPVDPQRLLRDIEQLDRLRAAGPPAT